MKPGTDDSNDVEPSNHSDVNRRRLLGGLAGAAVATGLGTTSGTAARGEPGTLTASTEVSTERARQATRTVLGSERTEALRQSLEDDGVSPVAEHAKTYHVERDGVGTLEETNRMVTVVPYEGEDRWFSETGMGFLFAVTTEDEDGGRSVAATLGVSSLEVYSSFWDYLFGDPSEAAVTVHRGGGVGIQSVDTIEERRDIREGEVGAQFTDIIICLLCNVLSEVLCELLDEFGEDLCLSICQDNETCEDICQVLVQFVDDTVCANPGEVCDLIGC